MVLTLLLLLLLLPLGPERGEKPTVLYLRERTSGHEKRGSNIFPSYIELERTPTKAILDGLKRNMSRGNSLSDELELSSVLGYTRAYLYSPVLG